MNHNCHSTVQLGIPTQTQFHHSDSLHLRSDWEIVFLVALNAIQIDTGSRFQRNYCGILQILWNSMSLPEMTWKFGFRIVFCFVFFQDTSSSGSEYTSESGENMYNGDKAYKRWKKRSQKMAIWRRLGIGDWPIGYTQQNSVESIKSIQFPLILTWTRLIK